MAKPVHLTGRERTFQENEIIVSKTDLKGRITYANRTFLEVAGYTEKEVMGEPHSILRHPAMPRAVFKLMWDTLGAGEEIFAYVINRCKNGDHYWVNAHVTPSRNTKGELVGYHSNRRVPDRRVVEEKILPLYKSLKALEDGADNRKDGLVVSSKAVADLLASKGCRYDEFIATLKHA
ncbi:PAS domain-containing protein [Roseibium suaedae]|uniref:PAS domain S-box-containing protein n=1 Tax=Roseibium suaedae TaxID=735517 RepID=A0A1M7CKL4_9HYPH|nr:PAS domain-containing protein [Roseibium suaedae]SHL67776.1 PAS domain S-box-containing protein [Roseibium suaedae]